MPLFCMCILPARQSESSHHDTTDDGGSIVLYFLSNATTWRGEDARRIKAELKSLLK